MPINSYPLFVDVQYEIPCIWVKVSVSKTMKNQKIVIKGTGRDFDDTGLQYVGSFMQAEGRLVWHVFWNNRE